jgi:alpha-D-ribose 1-methylphosphonate 5-phosphate C-P lyase
VRASGLFFLALAAAQKIREPVTQTVAVRKQIPTGSHLQPTRFVYGVGGITCTVTTLGRMFNAISLFSR